ncbi:hypothetical protein SMGD1_1448 [Sulfurimonas gotlandica GD1]|uniref:HupE/UreJ family protein n=1 Tax=Sulfurimonas gotlandica (strain DSM 19862 / JCM 16533 / GD1) TaxID=929558 RepID=B6BHH5_SULGG|nr:HupE/UreJ family protein [Sulfurimonas gotlandica]EDZ63144.1 conserved hypothetical protein [Sulfurimonas gotlandica GD1]EHP29972.1 hypothetical protein SMGD1_1448 [Sulfurimonas gotlandica GD1]
MKIFFLLIASLFFSAVAYAHGISEADKQAMIDGGNLRYIWLGATHMLSGYDHLLFLFGVVFFLTTTKDIIKFVTIFTIGHSITLIFATFMGINANYYLIDAVIAISVIYKAFDNNKGFGNYLGVKSPNLLVMVLLFGLIHGFGLSTRLQQLPLGEQNWDMLLRIISFNVGVELGQIIALIFMLVVLTQWRKRKSFLRLSKVTNHALMFAGFMLLLMQLHGYLHTTNEEEFGFNKDAHQHIHMDMEAKQKEYIYDSL